MSVSQPARCLLNATKPSIPRTSSILPRPRSFHQSCRWHNRKPRVPSIKASDLITRSREPVTIDSLPLAESAARWRSYTEAEKEAMKHHYTPSQIAAIEAAESAVPAEDLATQAVLRNDPWSMNYLDDLRQIDPLVDKQPKAVVTDVGPMPEFLKQSEFLENGMQQLDDESFDRLRKDLDDFVSPRWEAFKRDPRSFEELLRDVRESVLPQKVKDHLCGYAALIGTEKEAAARDRISAVLKMVGKPPVKNDRRRFLPAVLSRTLDGDAHMDDPRYSALAPAIPKFDDPNVRWPTGDEDDPSQAGIQRLALQTGFQEEDIRRFKTKRLVQHRVVNQTRMGKIQSIYVLSIAGNGNGLFGIGEGKSAEPEDARRQSMLNAIRNMKPIHRYENRTIYGDVHAKVGATEVQLMSRPPGFGIRCMHLIFEICRVCGIHDLAARVTRARNPMNTVKATYEALTKQRLPEDIARARGRKLVDVRKVYYAGQVY